MRNVCGLALVIASASLSGCVNSTFDSLSSQNTGCSTTTISVACTSPVAVVVTPAPNLPATPTAPVVPVTPVVTTGDTTIALEKSLYTAPTTAGTTSLSQLLKSPLTVTNGTSAADQQITINTNTATNGTWPAASTLKYDDYGTCVNNFSSGAVSGTCSTFLGGPGTGGTGLGGIDPATGIDPSVTTSTGAATTSGSNTSLSGNYKQYRNYSKGVSDQELQVWTWNNSYATQYRDVLSSGTAPAHQAWSFGGNYTTAASMPIAGTATYAGQFGATATTSNWIDVTRPRATGTTTPVGAQIVSANNTWQINGNSALTANFGTGKFFGYLTPRNWTGVNSTGGLTNINIADAQANNAACYNPTTGCNADIFNSWSNYTNFMTTKVYLQGNITTDATNAAKPNQIVGNATLDPTAGWITSTGTNPFYGGFFGGLTSSGKPQEVTGAFAADGAHRDPNGGVSPINNDRSGYLSMSGIFNGQ